MKTEEEEIKNFIIKYAGYYLFRSPYHKSKKMLPFTIVGRSYNTDFPISVDTVQYRGWEKENRTDDYTIESLIDKIESGFLTKLKN